MDRTEVESISLFELFAGGNCNYHTINFDMSESIVSGIGPFLEYVGGDSKNVVMEDNHYRAVLKHPDFTYTIYIVIGGIGMIYGSVIMVNRLPF